MSRNEKNELTTQMADKKRFIVMVAVIVCFACAGAARTETNWGVPLPFVTERQKLIASDGAANDGFGYSVFISGDHAIIGAYCDDDKGSNSGSAYIFKWNGTTWVEQQKLLASDGAAHDSFGISVSISGDYAIIGAYYDDDKGSAYIFKWDGTGWVQHQKLTASDGSAWDEFGISVSISGDYAIVGAEVGEGNISDTGSAYVFKWDGTSWTEQQKLLASDGAAGDFFGYSVSVSGDLVIVGATKGLAYIFKWNGASWSEQQKLTASDGGFGISVSISGDHAIVGAKGGDGNIADTGSAYVFKWDGTSWSEQQKLTASDGAANDQFGLSVSISGDYVIVGADGDDSSKGSAYMFKWNGTSWSQQAKLLASDGAAADYFGYSVSVSGDRAIVGAYGDDSYKGSAYAFEFCPRADLNGDCKVDFVDLALFADKWLYGTD